MIHLEPATVILHMACASDPACMELNMEGLLSHTKLHAAALRSSALTDDAIADHLAPLPERLLIPDIDHAELGGVRLLLSVGNFMYIPHILCIWWDDWHSNKGEIAYPDPVAHF